MRCFFLFFFLLFSGGIAAAPLDDEIELGGFHPNMSLKEADALAGSPGQRECHTWPPNPTIHWCRWTFQDAAQHVQFGYGADGVIHDFERRVPLPDGMSDAEALKQAEQKLGRYGKPAIDVIPGDLHWGCMADDCSGPRMIRVWIMSGHKGFFGGRRHMTIGWSNRLRSKANQDRFLKESKEWQIGSKKKGGDSSRLKL